MFTFLQSDSCNIIWIIYSFNLKSSSSKLSTAEVSSDKIGKIRCTDYKGTKSKSDRGLTKLD